MTFWIINYSITSLICAFYTGITIPQILLVAFHRQLFNLPDEWRIHCCAVPRLGDIVFKPIVFSTVALLLRINMVIGHSEMLFEIENDVRPLVLAFCFIIVLYLVDMTDDLIGIRYQARFVVQVLCNTMFIVGGIYIDNLYGILDVHSIPLWLGYPLTIPLAVFIINIINLISGTDGLTSRLCSIARLLHGLTFSMFHQYIYAMLAFATLGVLAPSFYYNVFGNAKHEKEILMGDTGSLTVGMMFYLLSLKLTMCETDDNTVHINPMVLAFSPLLVPCCDAVRIHLYRVRNEKNPFLPDKNRIRHKLLAAGM